MQIHYSKVFDIQKCTYDMICCYQWLSWHHASHVLLAGTVDGEMWMWLVPQGNTRTFPSYGSASLCGTFLHDGKQKLNAHLSPNELL